MSLDVVVAKFTQEVNKRPEGGVDLVANGSVTDDTVLADSLARNRDSSASGLHNRCADISHHLAKGGVSISAPRRCRQRSSVDPGHRLAIHHHATHHPIEQVLECSWQCARILWRANQQRVRFSNPVSEIGYCQVKRLAIVIRIEVGQLKKRIINMSAHLPWRELLCCLQYGGID